MLNVIDDSSNEKRLSEGKSSLEQPWKDSFSNGPFVVHEGDEEQSMRRLLGFP